MSRNGVVEIPDEWTDPRLVIPHLTSELRDWHLTMRSIEHDLAVILGGLDPDGRPVDPIRLREWITSVHARLAELNHSVAGRLQAFVLICEELERHVDEEAAR